MQVKLNDLLKRTFNLKITTMQRGEKEDSFKVVDSQFYKVTKKEFIEGINEDKKDGINHTIKIVTKAPEQFQFNCVYVLLTGDKVWSYILDEGE